MVLVVLVGGVGGMYGSLARLSGLGVYHLEGNWFGASWIVDDPIVLMENGSLVTKLSNEVGWEPYLYIYSGTPPVWNNSYAYGVINTEWASVGVFINPLIMGEGYLAGGSGLFRPWFDIVVGTKKVPYVVPYIGLTVGASAETSIIETVNSTVNPAITTKTIAQQSVSLVKLRAGAGSELFKPLILDASVSVWFPGMKDESRGENSSIANYKNEMIWQGVGNIGLEAKVYPKMRLSPSLEWKNMLTYRYLNLSSNQIVSKDLNGDGDYLDATEAKTTRTDPYSKHIIGLGTGVNYTISQLFAYASLNYFLDLENTGTFTINQASGNDIYQPKTEKDNTYNYIILTGGAEVSLKKWFSLRMGIMDNISITTKKTTTINYDGTSDNRETTRTIDTASEIQNSIIPQIGLSVHFGGFSLDWVMSDTFIQNVLGQGRLPYIISGNNLFDNFSMIVSINYRF